MKRRELLSWVAAAACLPTTEFRPGSDLRQCRVLGPQVSLALPRYPRETRTLDAPFSADFLVSSGADENTVLWRRASDGSTRVTFISPLFFGLVDVRINYVSDLRRGKVIGFTTFGGGLAERLRASGLPAGEAALVLGGADAVEEMPIRPGDREDGGAARGRLDDVADWKTAASAGAVLIIENRRWPCTRLLLESPRGRELEVWVSEELGVVLKEEERFGDQVTRSYRALTIDRAEPDPRLFDDPSAGRGVPSR